MKKLNIRTLFAASSLSTRSSAELIQKKIEEILASHAENPSKIVLDFEGMQFISRSFAHELLQLQDSYRQRKKVISLSNLSEDLESMIALVQRSKENNYPKERSDLFPASFSFEKNQDFFA